MGRSTSSSTAKSRELRTRVVLPARIRSDSGWSDACILNLSSRGLLINSGGPAAEGSVVELRHGDHVIVARVIWREGSRTGLRTQDRVPVEDIVTGKQAQAVQLTAPQWPAADRRKQPRTHEQSRMRSRALEFAGVAVTGGFLAAAVLSMVEQAFARPLATVQSALGG